MQSASESSSPQPNRLPVNPRRHKVAPEQRKRVVRACNACNLRRVRCSGDQPCQRCSKSSSKCEYSAPESDRNALRIDNDRLRARCAALEKAFLAAAPVDAARLLAQLDHGTPLPRSSPSTISSASTFSPASPILHDQDAARGGRLLCDGHGRTRFLGETSGATFLDCLRDFMWQLAPMSIDLVVGHDPHFVNSFGRYQTYDSRPLPDPHVDLWWMPTPTEMTRLLAELRHLVQDGNGDFQSGGIYFWGDLSTLPTSLASSGLGSLSNVTRGERSRAFHHVCFALASFVCHPSVQPPERQSEACFNRARKLLGNPLDTVRFTLSDVPVLALMGFYLIELNRRDAAYMYVSMAIHIAIIHGAFSRQCGEAEKRIYWTLYIMDRWLSVLMGRPPTIADQAIKIACPCDVDSLPPAAGLRAHVELARITGYIVCETFNIAPREPGPNYSMKNIDKALEMLEAWQAQLPSTLVLTPNKTMRDPACITLHMAQLQLVILVTRPILMAATKQAIARCLSNSHWPDEQHPQARHIRTCSEAAHRNLVLAQGLKQMRKPLQAGLHFIFNATVILLLTRIVRSNVGFQADAPDGYPEPSHVGELESCAEIRFAMDVFEQESRTGTNYPRDCFKVLKDLDSLVANYLSRGCGGLRQGGTTPYNEDLDMPQVFATWMQSDGLQLHDSLLI